MQAGGRGTRLGHLTTNKPKALVPVENLPMIFHLFRKFPDKRFVVIADYHRETLREYLAAFADVNPRSSTPMARARAAAWPRPWPYCLTASRSCWCGRT